MLEKDDAHFASPPAETTICSLRLEPQGGGIYALAFILMESFK